MSKTTKQCSEIARQVLENGEEVHHALRANLKGTALGMGLLVGGGGIVGAAVGSVVMSQGHKRGLNFPTEQQMAFGITNKRVLVFSRSAMSGKPNKLIGEFSFLDATEASLKKGLLPALSIQFADGNVLKLECVRKDDPTKFTELLNMAITNASVVQPPPLLPNTPEPPKPPVQSPPPLPPNS